MSDFLSWLAPHVPYVVRAYNFTWAFSCLVTIVAWAHWRVQPDYYRFARRTSHGNQLALGTVFLAQSALFRGGFWGLAVNLLPEVGGKYAEWAATNRAWLVFPMLLGSAGAFMIAHAWMGVRYVWAGLVVVVTGLAVFAL